MKNTILLTLIIVSIFLGASCRDTSTGELIKESSKKYVNETLNYKTDYQNKRIALEGFIYPKETTDIEAGIATLEISTQPKSGGDNLADVKISLGEGKNEVIMPTQGKGKEVIYKTTQYDIDESKLKFVDNEGNQHPITDKVRLSGTVKYVDHFEGGFSHMPDPMNKGKELYPFVLKDVRLDALK